MMEVESGLPTTFSTTTTALSLNLLVLTFFNSIFVKVASGIIIVLYFCSFNTFLFDHLCVIPGYVLPPNVWIWTLVTHTFLQSRILLVLVDLLIVFLTGIFIEPAYKLLKLGLFFVIVTAFSALSSSMVYIFLYYIKGNTDYVFETRIFGLSAYAGGLSVAIKQLMPDKVLLPMPWGKLKNKHIPMILLVTVITLSTLHILHTPYALQTGFGILISWIYLRFYQKHDNGNVGDMAEDFSFTSLFPQPLQLPVAIVSNTLFSLLVRLKLCKKPQRKYDVSSPATITVTLPGTDPADAERRRQLAIKALNDRLNATADSELNEESRWPGLVDEDEDVNTNSTPSDTTGAANSKSKNIEATKDSDTTPIPSPSDATS